MLEKCKQLIQFQNGTEVSNSYVLFSGSTKGLSFSIPVFSLSIGLHKHEISNPTFFFYSFVLPILHIQKKA